MFDDVIGDIKGLDLGLVAPEEFEADGVRAVGTGGIGDPRQVRVGEQIDVHRVTENGFVEPFGHVAEGIFEPDFRHDEFGVEKDRLRL